MEKIFEMGKASYSLRYLFLTISSLLLFITDLSYADPGKVVFYLDKDYQPVVKLDRIAPLSEGLKAILAMYALQNDTGCTGVDEDYSCELTDALSVGGQCSKNHIEIVRSWFKSGMPNMSFNSGGIEDICYKTPETATFQQKWDLIRVEIKNNHILVYAHGAWLARDNSGSFKYISEYEINRDSITVVSNKHELH